MLATEDKQVSMCISCVHIGSVFLEEMLATGGKEVSMCLSCLHIGCVSGGDASY